MQVGMENISATPQILEGKERYEAWQKLIAYYPAFGKYQDNTDREIPVIRFMVIY